jgi:hypothetical protein
LVDVVCRRKYFNVPPRIKNQKVGVSSQNEVSLAVESHERSSRPSAGNSNPDSGVVFRLLLDGVQLFFD